MDDGEDAELARLDWIVWTLEVRDPEQRAAPDIGERTEQAMTEMAGSLGCVYSHCADDDSYDLTPEGTFYTCRFASPQRAPAARRARRIAPAGTNQIARERVAGGSLLSSVPKRDENRSSEMRRVIAVDVPAVSDQPG